MTELVEVRPELLTQLRERQQGRYRVYTDSQASAEARTYIPGQQDLGERGRNLNRTAFVMTCESWSQEGRYISFWANPSEISWTIGQRASKQKTKNGSVLHVWRDRERGTFFDEPILGFTFQSGNIWPIRIPPAGGSGSTTSPTTTASSELQPNPFPAQEATTATDWELIVPPGLDSFYETLALIDEEKSLDDGRPNSVYIMLNTPEFPQLTLIGFFEPEGVTWSTSPDTGSVVTWNASFEVHHTQPAINDPAALRRAFLSTIPRRPVQQGA